MTEPTTLTEIEAEDDERFPLATKQNLAAARAHAADEAEALAQRHAQAEDERTARRSEQP
jgi:hypothetical protein